MRHSDLSQIAYLEGELNKLKELNRRNNEISKRRFAVHEAEKVEFRATITELESKIAALTSELDALKAGAQEVQSATATKEQELSHELDALRQQKTELEQRLQSESNTSQAVDTTRITELEAEFVGSQPI